jgi:formylglycine-generating enzyme required for sulfatase activity
MPAASPPPRSVVLAPNYEPIPDYRLVRRLGDGGSGEVWQATAPGGYDTALKFVRLDKRLGQAEAEHRENLTRVRHDHLLPVYASWVVDGYLILQMELAEKTLADECADCLKAGQPGIPAARLHEYLRHAAEGLDYLNHDCGIIHRDIKPANLMLVRKTVKVADFGMAKKLDEAARSRTGGFTLHYAAPELFDGRKTPTTDQYSLAVTYCELLTGKLPFNGSWHELITKHASEPPNLLMLPEGERPVVARAMAKAPHERWPSCRAFVEALTQRSASPARVFLTPLEPLVVTAGHTAEVAVHVRREHCTDAPLAVSLVRLPAGVEAAAAVIPAGADAARVLLTTRADALPGKRTVIVAVKGGRVADEQELPLTIRAAVVERLAVRLPDAVDLRTGQANGVKVSVTRENVSGDVQLEWCDLPAGVRPDKPALAVPAQQDETTLSLATGWGARDDAIVRLAARLGGLQTEAVTRLHIDRVAPPTLDSTAGPLDMASVRHVQQQWAEFLHLKVVEWVELGPTRLRVQLIPPGKFWMGSPEDDEDAFADERPRHKVRIGRPFYLASTPVTVGQFRAFVEATRHRTGSDDGEFGWGYNAAQNAFEQSPAFSWQHTGWPQTDDHPVVNVSWGDAHAFVKWLRKLTPLAPQLPTEDEWEYACRAGTTARHFSGDDPASLEGYANVADAAYRRQRGTEAHHSPAFDFDDGYPFTSPVARYKPNHFGLFDMIGNVWEWCADGVRDYRDKDGRPDAALGRITRGGCWDTGPGYCRAATRGRQFPSYRSHFVGFRVALLPAAEAAGGAAKAVPN